MKNENNLRKDSAGIGSLPVIPEQNKISEISELSNVPTTNLTSDHFSPIGGHETKKSPVNTMRGRCHKH